MVKAGFTARPPHVSVERGSLNQAQQVEFWVSELRQVVSRLNVQLTKCHLGGVKCTLKLKEAATGEPVVLDEFSEPTADTAAFKRPVEYWVHDARSSVGRLNVLLQKCQQVNVKVTLKMEQGDAGEPIMVLESVVLP